MICRQSGKTIVIMKLFKKIALPLQGHNKESLHWLYDTKTSDEPPKIFHFNNLKFWFGGSSNRSTEKMHLFVEIPRRQLCEDQVEDSIPYETYLLHVLSPIINELSNSYQNINKNIREKAQFESQVANEYFAKRSGISYVTEHDAFLLRVNFNAPLINAVSVNAKALIRAITDILQHIVTSIHNVDPDELNLYITTFFHQKQIRQYLKEHGFCSFVANGSILPRENGTSAPMTNAIPFSTPKELEIIIHLFDGTSITGMGVKKGITIITGGGYSGKSTLLDAIEMGIYDHIPGDGREYVLTDKSALKTCAEDGRPVSNLDISPFFKFLSGSGILNNFSSLHASGSVSQAANIIEAVCGKCKLLLIDEDKSANNFMIRDKIMRFIVKDEPIIPFSDRVRELFNEKSVSTILVIGGSSEYLPYADTVILMKDYLPQIITLEIQTLGLSPVTSNEKCANWIGSRRLMPKKTTKQFLYFKSVKIEKEKKIVLDEHSADITQLTAIISEEQLNTLACVMERLLTDKNADSGELLEKIDDYIKQVLANDDTESFVSAEAAQRFYEIIRPIDAFCCINRMRNISFYHI